MRETLGSRFKRAWNVFTSRQYEDRDYGGYSSYSRPDRVRLSRGKERSIVSAVCNRIAMDVAAIDIRHVRLDDNDRYKETIPSTLNNILTLEANIDQTARAFRQDIVMSLLDEGAVAVVPVDVDDNVKAKEIEDIGPYKILTMRTGKILEWFPAAVRIDLYNDQVGQKQQVTLPKTMVSIIENPLYAVMNESSSTMQRLVRKLNLLDAVDEQSGSGKLDLIIQLPYVIKTEARKKQADERRKEIERQLNGSKYGIAYADGTERITQLNRPVENNLMAQIEYLTNMLFSQLGITQSILDGTADENTMLNYYNRVVEPIAAAIVDEFKRKFLTKTARSQKQSIEYFRDPLKLIPISQLAEISDKMTRNEILSSNEIRQAIGVKPSADPKADELRNSNLSAPKTGNAPNEGVPPSEEAGQLNKQGGEIQNE